MTTDPLTAEGALTRLHQLMGLHLDKNIEVRKEAFDVLDQLRTLTTAPTPGEELVEAFSEALAFLRSELKHVGNIDREPWPALLTKWEAALASVAGGESDLSPTDYYHGFYRGDERGDTPTDAEERAREIADELFNPNDERESALNLQLRLAINAAITEALAAEKARGDELEEQLKAAHNKLNGVEPALASEHERAEALKAERDRLLGLLDRALTALNRVHDAYGTKRGFASNVGKNFFNWVRSDIRAALTKSEKVDGS